MIDPSMVRKNSSPSWEKMSGIERPSRSSINASMSRTGQPNLALSPRATVDLPVPLKPINTIRTYRVIYATFTCPQADRSGRPSFPPSSPVSMRYEDRQGQHNRRRKLAILEGYEFSRMGDGKVWLRRFQCATRDAEIE